MTMTLEQVRKEMGDKLIPLPFVAAWLDAIDVHITQPSRPAQPASTTDKARAFEWLRGVALADGSPEEAGIALDAWHALAALEKTTFCIEYLTRQAGGDVVLTRRSIRDYPVWAALWVERRHSRPLY